MAKYIQSTVEVKAEVTSSNIVGYQKVNIGTGLTMIGMPFVEVGGQDDVDIQKIVPNNTETKGGVAELRVWNGSAYTTYYYYSAESEGIDDDENPGWGDRGQEAVSVAIPAGQGFWIRSNSSETITTSGEITEAVSVPIGIGLTMVCNPQPVDIDIQQVVPSNTQTKGGVAELRMWNGSAYTTYYYYSAESEGIDDDENPGWGDRGQEAVSATIPAGAAFWVRSNSAETLTFPNVFSNQVD